MDPDSLLEPPRDYAEWLALTPDQQEWVNRRMWNPYIGVGRRFAVMAAARLMMADTRIQDVAVGIYHGGEYILTPTVSNLDIKSRPAWLEQVFEGFRVGWLKESYEFDPDRARKFEGTWMCEDGRCDAAFEIRVSGNTFDISGHQASTGKPLTTKLGHSMALNCPSKPVSRPAARRRCTYLSRTKMTDARM